MDSIDSTHSTHLRGKELNSLSPEEITWLESLDLTPGEIRSLGNFIREKHGTRMTLDHFRWFYWESFHARAEGHRLFPGKAEEGLAFLMGYLVGSYKAFFGVDDAMGRREIRALLQLITDKAKDANN